MIRNLKALGLVLAAVVALSAVAASAASAANGSLTSDGPVTLTGKPTGEPSSNAFVAFKDELTCPNATYTGHKYNVTPHELLPSGAEAVTITPNYGLCSTSGFPTTVDMNGCDYVFELGETVTGSKDEYQIRSTIVCPPEKHITMTIFGSAAKHSENKPFCHVTITQNGTGYNGLVAQDTTNGDIAVTHEIFQAITADKKSPNGSILCPEASENATLRQDITFQGKNATGTETEISLSHF